MFEKYKKFPTKFVKMGLPKGKMEHWISEDGQVFRADVGLLPQKKNSDGLWVIKSDLWEGEKEYLVSLLMVVVFKNLKLPFDELGKVMPFHIDGNRDNFHPSNIGYRYSSPIESKFNRGYYHIPMLNKYVVNVKGDLLYDLTSHPLKSYTLKADEKRKIVGGYRYYFPMADVGGQHTIARHRVLALVFIPYPDNVDKLDVNHINGDGGDDRLENMEWVTRSQNNIHAVKAGLKNQNIVFFAKNVFTGEERRFNSCNEAYRTFNEGDNISSNVSWRLRQPGQKLFYGGWMFKTDPNEPWREVIDPHKELRHSSSCPTKVFSKNVFTGEVREHLSIAKVGYDLGFKSPKTVTTLLLKNETHPYNGYLFKTEDDRTPWPEFSERELAVFRDNPTGQARGVVAYKDSGEELFFTNIKNAAAHFNKLLATKNDVIKAIARNRNVDGYRLRYL